MIYVKHKYHEDEVFALHSFVKGEKLLKAICIDKKSDVKEFYREDITVVEEGLIREIKLTNEYYKYFNKTEPTDEDLG